MTTTALFDLLKTKAPALSPEDRVDLFQHILVTTNTLHLRELCHTLDNDVVDAGIRAWFDVKTVMPERAILRDRMRESLKASIMAAADRIDPVAITSLQLQLNDATAEVARLNAIINTPHTSDFLQAVSIEAEFQVQKWGTADREGKEPHDWFWLLGYLAGKALTAFLKGDHDKGLHHIISSAAALMNWHRYSTGKSTAMRPGIGNANVGA